MPASTTKRFIGAIDQGTSSTKFIIYNHGGQPVGVHQIEHKQIYPQRAWVEHDPEEIWENTLTCISKALEAAGITTAQLDAIGITNQRESTLIWNKQTGKPYYNVIVWNDTRTRDICDELMAAGDRNRFRQKTGLPISPYFSASKILWMFENVPGVREDAAKGDALFGNLDAWLLYNLTGGKLHMTDVTNASRTLLMNLKTLSWDKEILSALNIPASMLPEIRSSSEVYAEATVEVLRGVRIAGVLGDQQSALFGQTCFQAGQAKATYGTGSFLLMNTGGSMVPSQTGLLTTVAYKLGNQAPSYALEGSVAYCGSLIQWLRDNLKLITTSSESETLAQQVNDNGGIYFVPAFSGLFAPYWRDDARGVIVGLTAFNNRFHFARAALESAAYQVQEVLEAMQKDSGVMLQLLKVDGGMTENELLMQFQSDLLEVPVLTPQTRETTSLGAAFAAGIAVGFWKNFEELRCLWSVGKKWDPYMPDQTRRKLLKQWKKAVERTFGWVEKERHDEDAQRLVRKPSIFAAQISDSCSLLSAVVLAAVGSAAIGFLAGLRWQTAMGRRRH